MATQTQAPAPAPAAPPSELQQAAGKILGHAAGYVATRTLEAGLRHGIFKAIAEAPNGLTAEQIASATNLDPSYTGVWCRAAYAAELIESNGGAYTLAPYVDTILLDEDSPAYAAGTLLVTASPEVSQFIPNMATGEALWWDKTSEDFIKAVSFAGKPFYTRLFKGGLAKVPGFDDKLKAGGSLLELACGLGRGIVGFAAAYPNATFTAQDGDAASLELARQLWEEASISDRVKVIHSTMEDVAVDQEFDVVLINISMHESRDLDKVAQNAFNALKPGGIFVISDFPFPDTPEASRTVPGRLMTGIQFFEAMIGDQLLPTKDFVELLNKHGFACVDSFDLAPVHAVTYGRRP
jgi:predicted O-methyltransferase YrrM